MKHETNGKSNREQLILTAAVVGADSAGAENSTCFAANDRCSR